MTMDYTINDLFVDLNQNQRSDGRCFGFVGRDDTDGYQGLFFTYPGSTAKISTEAELESVLDSLDPDETCPNEEQIDMAMAREKLEEVLREKNRIGEEDGD